VELLITTGVIDARDRHRRSLINEIILLHSSRYPEHTYDNSGARAAPPRRFLYMLTCVDAGSAAVPSRHALPGADMPPAAMDGRTPALRCRGTELGVQADWSAPPVGRLYSSAGGRSADPGRSIEESQQYAGTPWGML
jgi:hypothetical protein